MDAIELKEMVEQWKKSSCSLQTYAILEDKNSSEKELKKIVLDNIHRSLLLDSIKESLADNIINKDFQLESIYDILDEEGDRVYCIDTDSEYDPFPFIRNVKEELPFFDSTRENRIGTMYRLSLDDKDIWLYKHLYPQFSFKKDRYIPFYKDGDGYTGLDAELIFMESRFDALISEGKVFVLNLSPLEMKFGVQQFIVSKGGLIAQDILNTNLICDTNGIFAKFSSINGNILSPAGYDKHQIKIFKKMLKVKNYPVLKISNSSLIQALITHPVYSNILKINSNQIIIENEEDLMNVLDVYVEGVLESGVTKDFYKTRGKTKIQ